MPLGTSFCPKLFLSCAVLVGCAVLLSAAEPGRPPEQGLPGSGSLLVCDSSSDKVVRLTDRDGSGRFEAEASGEVAVFYDDASPGPDLSTPSHMVREGKRVYLLDGGTLDAVLALEDRNLDGDTNDDGEVWVFYDASQGGPKLSTPNTILPAPGGGFFVSDDGSGAKRLLRIWDRDGDGDAFDAQEVALVYDATALSTPFLSDLESLTIGPGSILYAGDTTLQSIFAMEDLTGDGDYLDQGEVRLFFAGTDELPLLDIEALALRGSSILAADRDSGRIVELTDRDSNGDALGVGEATLFFDGATPAVVKGIQDMLPLEGGGVLVLDNAKDAVVLLEDHDGDGAVSTEGEVTSLLVDGGATLSTPHGLVWLPEADEPQPVLFLRGDTTGDLKLDISDPVRTLSYLFLGAPVGPCEDAHDTDDSGVVSISDAVYSLSYLFGGGPSPAMPYPAQGQDPTEDTLRC